eukprot:2686879-Amphidinium_carterae.1
MDRRSAAHNSEWKPVVSHAGDQGGPVVGKDLTTGGPVRAAVLVVLPGCVTHRQHSLSTP